MISAPATPCHDAIDPAGRARNIHLPAIHQPGRLPRSRSTSFSTPSSNRSATRVNHLLTLLELPLGSQRRLPNTVSVFRCP